MRQDLVQQLAQALQGVVSRRVGLALGVWGEAGIGKTWTTQHLLRDLSCPSLSLHATVPDATLLGALPRPRKLTAWAEVQLARLNKGEHLEPKTTLNTLAAVLSGLAPFVLHLEDLHECGPERREMIVGLASALQHTRGVGLLVTGRQEPPQPFRNQRLEPLDAAETRALLEGELGAELPPEALRWLEARTGGNPLFALEFERYLAMQGFLWSDGKRWHWRTPPEGYTPVLVEALISQMIESTGQSSQTRAVLEARTVLPLEVSNEIWALTAGVDLKTLQRECHTLEGMGLLRERGFTHPLMAEVTRHEMSAVRRRGYALRAMEAFEPHSPLQSVNYVTDAGLEPAEAVRRLIGVAHSLDKAKNPLQAAHLLARAAELSWGSERATLALEAARAFGDRDVVECERMARMALLEPALRQQAACVCAEALLRSARSKEAWQVLEGLPEKEKTGLGWWQMQLSFYSLRDELGDGQKLLDLWEAHPEFHLQATVANMRPVLRQWSLYGQASRVEAFIAQMLERGNLSTPEWASLQDVRLTELYYQAQYEQGEKGLSELLEALDPTLYPLDHANQRSKRSTVLSRLGRDKQAHEDIEAACALYLSTGALSQYASLQNKRALTLIYLLEYERAEAVLLEGLALAQQQEASTLYDCYGHLSFLYLRWNPPHGPLLARRYAQLSLEAARGMGYDYALESALEDCIRAELRCQNPQAALEYALELSDLAERTGLAADLLASLGLLGRTYALMENWERAEPLLRQAEALYRANDQPAEAHFVALELDRFEGNAEAARLRLEWFEAHGRVHYANRVRHYFPQWDTPEGVFQTPRASARLKVLGLMVLEREGQPVHYRGHKRAELLAYLLERRIAGHQGCSSLELLDTLYPEISEDEGKRTLKQQIYLIRGDLGRSSILSIPGGYALGAVSSDAEDFLATGNPALWRGPYLEGLGEGWIGGVKDALFLALRAKLEPPLEREKTPVLPLARSLCGMEPYDLNALTVALRALLEGAGTPTARAFYLERRTLFVEVGEALPASLEAFLESIPL